MATSSSAKKAAQVAARSSGAASKRNQWLFPAAIVAIVVLGISVVWFAREENVGIGDNDTPPLAQLTEGGAYDHWHSAFSVNVCGKEIGPFSDATATDVLGIHAHAGEALIHVHPFSLRSAGDNAKMQHFFDQVNLTVTDTSFKVPTGEVYSEAETTCGGEPAVLTMSYWQKPLEATEATPDDVYTEDFGAIRFREDQSAYSLALLPEGETPALPEGVGSLLNPTDLATGDSVPGDISIPEGAVPDASTPEATVPEGSEPEATEPGDTPAPAAATEDEAPEEPATETTAAGSAG